MEDVKDVIKAEGAAIGALNKAVHCVTFQFDVQEVMTSA